MPSFLPTAAPPRAAEPPPSRVDKSQPRAIEAVLAELQRERRESSRPGSGFDVFPTTVGSHDTGDGSTTNLFVNGLVPSVDEQALKLLFGHYGALASVKMMWPRNEEEARARGGRMSGFVAFMTRRSAEEAMQHLNGYLLHGSELHLGWGKPVPIPSVPVWPPASHTAPPWASEPPRAPPPPPPPPQPLPPPPPLTAERSLVDAERSALSELLAALTMERGSVRAAMVWALDHAEAAREVSETVVRALTLPTASPPARVSLLFLLSDILSNCSVGTGAVAGSPRASYRELVGGALPEVFACLRGVLETLQLESRLTAQAMRRHVSSVLRAWTENGLMFSELFISGLEFLLAGGEAAETEDAALRAELSALPVDALRRRCRQSGLPTPAEEAQPALLARLLALHGWRALRAGGPAPQPAVAALKPQLPPPQKPAGGGGWTVVE